MVKKIFSFFSHFLSQNLAESLELDFVDICLFCLYFKHET